MSWVKGRFKVVQDFQESGFLLDKFSSSNFVANVFSSSRKKSELLKKSGLV